MIKKIAANLYSNKKLIYSIDLAMLFAGILLTILSVSTSGNTVVTSNQIRSFLGTIMVSFSFVLFPALDYDKKGKIGLIISIYFIFAVLSLFFCFWSLKYYLERSNSPYWLYEILAALGILFSISYVLYVFIAVIQTVYRGIVRIKGYLFSDVAKEGYSNAKKTIEGLTAFLVASTALVASVTAIVAGIKSLIK